MNFDQALELLKNNEPDIELLKKFYKNKNIDAELEKLKKQLSEDNFWQSPKFVTVSKKNKELESINSEFQTIIQDFAEFKELLEMSKQNPEELSSVIEEIKSTCKRISNLKTRLLLGKEKDNNNCFLSINPGAGGTESQDWASMLLRMYLRFCEKKGFSVKVLEHTAANEAGIKSATLLIKGENAFGLLKCETGIHRLVRISPFDANKKRHTSFSGVFVTPEAEETEIDIKPEDLKIDTYRASGAGGQHVNTTDSAVRITHIPTKIVAQCQNERSQAQNKQQAMKILISRIEQKKRDDLQAEKDSIEKKKIEWGSQIRSYVLHPYQMVKDHRTNQESPQPSLVLDGELDQFIQSCLVNEVA